MLHLPAWRSRYLASNPCCWHACIQSQLVKYGGVLRDDEPVHRIVSDGNIVTVTTSKTIHKARNIIIAAGPWTSQLTDPLDLALPLEVIYASYIKNYFFWIRYWPHIATHLVLLLVVVLEWATLFSKSLRPVPLRNRIRFLADRTATQYDRLLASSCSSVCPSVRPSVRLSVCL